jgi:hypothetical protein
VRVSPVLQVAFPEERRSVAMLEIVLIIDLDSPPISNVFGMANLS